MKYIAGIIIGLVLGGVGVVYAKDIVKTITLYEVKRVGVNDSYGTLIKFYDEDNGVACYVFGGTGNGSGAISCVK